MIVSKRSVLALGASGLLVVSVFRPRARLAWTAFVAAALAISVQPAFAADPAPAASERVEAAWTDPLTFTSPFSSCNMNCAVHVFAGAYMKSSMTSIFLKGRSPSSYSVGGSTFVGADFSREVVRYGDLWAFETEIGMGKRFGGQTEVEAWAALYWRWKEFPWNDVVRTSVAVSTGLNYASDVSRVEREKSPDHQSRLLHYLSPEITFGPPSNPNLDLVVRFHHRSGGELGVFDNTAGGSQYITAGMRYHW
ncbi:hypothetical protein [Hansschlegelia sp. KR7-227]|uniref:hypothetical protein n=1 Tax=Hansschlegelia sp. KR7-227 TaxID=3400914 RepID=UPI003C11CAB1